MPIPASQVWTVATYVLRQKLKGRKRYPLVLMLEPLFRCNLACAGCGKIQYPGHILKQHLTPEECFRAVEECGAPTVAVPGGEPLMHPEIDTIIKGLVARKKYVYLCTNGLLLKEKLHLFEPSKYLTFSVHMDGPQDHHDFAVCKEGTFDAAREAIREAVARGFRVTTNTTIFDGVAAKSMRAFFDQMMDAGVEGMMISPGYSYEKAPDQQHFLGRERNRTMFRKLLSNRSPRWRFNMSPLFLEFLMGRRHLACTPWGMPTYNLFGWQKPCYLLQEGYTQTFQELLESTNWEQYGFESGNPKCAHCMMHSGYEASAVNFTFTFRGILATLRAMLSPAYRDAEAMRQVENEKPQSPLVQIEGVEEKATLQGTRVRAGADLREGVDQAFDYRGDITMTLKSGERLDGYVFDRAPGGEIIHLMRKPDRQRVTVRFSDIEELSFTGRDMADGKSWAAWVRKYAAEKAAEVRSPEQTPEPIALD